MKISVITVCLNSVKTIERTIRSVQNQMYDDLEYIIIDGGSTDGTVEVIKRYEEFVSYWVSEEDDGLYDAMNKGIAKATGEIIAFLNSDDWYEKNALVKVKRYYEKYNPMILTGRVNTPQKGQWKKYVNLWESDKENIRMVMIYQQPATFTRREIFDQLGGFNTSYKIGGDFEWMLRVYDSGTEIMCVEDVFTNFSLRGISSTKADQTVREARKIALDALERCDKYDNLQKSKWREKINKLYDEQQAMADVKTGIRNQRLTDYPKLESSMLEYFTEKSYVVWGIGIIGEDIYHLLMQLGLNVEFFVDRKADSIVMTFHGRDVLPPKRLTRQNKIIVASRDYEDEIADELNEMGFQEENNYILYNNILLKLTEKYMKYYLTK